MMLITKGSDLLKAKPMIEQVKLHGEGSVKEMLMKSITKCLVQLSLDANPSFVETLSEDLIDVYSHDSIEDVTEALKSGRQGKGIWQDERGQLRGKCYGKLNMELIADWMVKQLEKKAIEREKALKNNSGNLKEPITTLNIYENYTPPETGIKKNKIDIDYDIYKAEFMDSVDKEKFVKDGK